MNPNELPPDEPSNRSLTLQFTRDNLILIAALVFLAIAISLAVFFPSETPNEQATNPTSVAEDFTPTDRVTPDTEPNENPGRVTEVPDSSYPGPDEPLPFPSVPDGYPGPDGAGVPTIAMPTSVTNLPGAPSPFDTPVTGPTEALPTFALPTFANTTSVPGTIAPNNNAPTPTESRFNVPTVTPSGGGDSSGYPGPGNGSPVATQAPANPTDTPQPTPTSEPTQAAEPTPTFTPSPTQQASDDPRDEPTVIRATPRPTNAPTPLPTEVPYTILRGNQRWTAAQGTITLTRDHVVPAGSSLIIEPGTTVYLAPGVSLYVEGTMYAVGEPGKPVRFTGHQSQRWDGIYGRKGSDIALSNVELTHGGSGGTLLMSEGGNLVVENSQIRDNGGRIVSDGSRMEFRQNEMTGNDLPYGSAVEASFSNGGFVVAHGNRIGGNRMADGAAALQINNNSATEIVNIDIQGNLLLSEYGPNMLVTQDGPYLGGHDVRIPKQGLYLGQISCNSMMSGPAGLQVRMHDNQVGQLNVSIRNNAIEHHSQPIRPEYTQPFHGLGRGAVSTVLLDMSQNWWGHASGPYEPDRHEDGIGDAVGDMILFEPWLTARPGCAPIP